MWNECESSYSRLSIGIKQWGVLSTTVFNLFIDQPLWKPGFGCHINHVYIGVVSYMDYITISRPVFMIKNVC